MTEGRQKLQTEALHRIAVSTGVSVRALEAFVTVARLRTMSAAAEHMGMSQSAVSQLVVQIENSLDIQLFDRKVRPPALTLQGAALLEPARDIISGVSRFHSALRWGPTTQMPRLRIAMVNSIAESVGPVVLSRLRSVAAQLILDTGFAATRARCVADREVDFIVTSDESPLPPGLQAVPLLTEPFLVVAPQSYKGDLQAVKQLSEALELIRFGRDPFMNSRLDQTLRAWGIEPTHAYQIDTQAAVLQMVMAGEGWTILPSLAVYRTVSRGEKIRVAPYPEPTMKRTILLVSRVGEGAVLTADIHEEAIKALRADYLAQVTAATPEIAALITLHEIEAASVA